MLLDYQEFISITFDFYKRKYVIQRCVQHQLCLKIIAASGFCRSDITCVLPPLIASSLTLRCISTTYYSEICDLVSVVLPQITSSLNDFEVLYYF